VPKSPAEVSHKELLLRLTAFAVRVLAQLGLCGREAAVMPGVGLSAEDFALKVFCDYLEGKIKDNTFPYLYTAIRNDILEKTRLSSYKTTVSLSPARVGDADSDDDTVQVAEFRDGKPLIDHVLSVQALSDGVRTCADGDPKLEQYVEAILDCECEKPAEIADLMGISVKEVYVLSRKLERRLIRVGLMKVPDDE
jgi:DNA-directed RNA polymerase specialized sigma24 family protein